MRSVTVYFCSTVYFFSTMYCKVWDLTLQIAVVMLPLYLLLLTAWWWLCLVAETWSCVLTCTDMCCVVGSFVGLMNTGTQLGWIDKSIVYLLCKGKVSFVEQSSWEAGMGWNRQESFVFQYLLPFSDEFGHLNLVHFLCKMWIFYEPKI